MLRKRLNYPPFCDIILIRVNGENVENVKRFSAKLYEQLLKEKNENLLIYQPVASPIDKIQNTYRWRIIIKGKLNRKAICTINKSISNLRKPKDVNIIVDTNPSNMM